MGFFTRAKPVLRPLFHTRSPWKVLPKVPPFPQFHDSSLISKAKGGNFQGLSLISTVKGVSFPGSHMHSPVSQPWISIPSKFEHNVRCYRVNHRMIQPFREKVQGLYQNLVPFLVSKVVISGSGISMLFFVEEKVEVFIFWLLASGINSTAFYFFNREMVPYTKRIRFLFPLLPLEKKVKDSTFIPFEQTFVCPTLSASDASKRLGFIAQNIMKALGRGIRSKQACWGNEIRRAEKGICYIDGIEWKFLVMDTDDEDLAPFTWHAGVIVLPSWILKVFLSDSEIAFIIAHEIGHVARQYAETVTRHSLLYPLNRMTFGLCKKITTDHAFNHKVEFEADYISIYLMAHAGYDPQVPAEMFFKHSKFFGAYDEDSFTHPSPKKRAEALSRAQLMEEALLIYQENKSRITV